MDKSGGMFLDNNYKKSDTREVGSHDAWLGNQTRDRPTSWLYVRSFLIKKEYVEFVSLSVIIHHNFHHDLKELPTNHNLRNYLVIPQT